MGSSKTSSAYLLYAGAVIVVIGIIIFGASQKKTAMNYENFAQCLTENGLTMYGTWWCSHCQNQKDEFGDAFSYVNYVECSPPGLRAMNEECEQAGIEGFPTWTDAQGNILPGEKTMTDLSEISGCALPEEQTE